MHSKYLDEFEPDQAFTTGKASLSEGQILDFAMMYDPQHMHIDHQSAENGPFGGVIASGFQTLSLSFRLFYDLGLIRQTNIIGVGMDELRWTAPVYPKDTLQVTATVTEVRPSGSKPDRGTLKWHLETHNHKGDMVMKVDLIMILRRDPALT